ncbi:MAG: hypothetical protein ACT4NY_32440 [Pseudonocardiales bacterium]
MVREYSEELLGEPEHGGTRSQAIDYEQWPLFQRLETEPMASSGSACLALAWRHRHALGL